MVTKSKDLGPLTWNVAIVDKNGRPSPEFQRRWDTQRQNNALIGTITFGSGAPTGTPEDGAEYVDTSTSPYTFYIGNGGTWHQTSASKFTDLLDAPHAYAGKTTDFVVVNSTEDGLEFLDGVQGDVIYRSAAGWAKLAAGTDGAVLTTHGASADPTWDASSGDLGFGFNATGLLSAGELLGAGIIPHDVTFDDTNALTTIICAIPPIIDTDMPIWTTDVSNILVNVGSIHVAAHATTGSLVLSPNPWLYIARHPIYLYAPTVAGTMAEVMGFIVGSKT